MELQLLPSQHVKRDLLEALLTELFGLAGFALEVSGKAPLLRHALPDMIWITDSNPAKGLCF